jgi:hypothetical protein
MSKVKVNNFPDLKKDLVNGGVVNSNIDSFESYKERRAKALKEISEKDAMKEEINTMRSELSDIKDMLKLLLDKQ